jgi:hypothetical protein
MVEMALETRLISAKARVLLAFWKPDGNLKLFEKQCFLPSKSELLRVDWRVFLKSVTKKYGFGSLCVAELVKLSPIL